MDSRWIGFLEMDQIGYDCFLGSGIFSARWIQKKNSYRGQSMPIDPFFTTLYLLRVDLFVKGGFNH